MPQSRVSLASPVVNSAIRDEYALSDIQYNTQQKEK
jgi:hypothetical protein